MSKRREIRNFPPGSEFQISYVPPQVRKRPILSILRTPTVAQTRKPSDQVPPEFQIVFRPPRKR